MTVQRILPIDSETLRAVNSKRQKKKTEAHVYYGPKPFRTRTAVVDRDSVLTLRRLREWAGWRPKEIALVLGMPDTYVHNVCAWTTRVDVDPGPRPHPDSEEGRAWARELFRYFGILDAAKG